MRSIESLKHNSLQIVSIPSDELSIAAAKSLSKVSFYLEKYPVLLHFSSFQSFCFSLTWFIWAQVSSLMRPSSNDSSVNLMSFAYYIILSSISSSKGRGGSRSFISDSDFYFFDFFFFLSFLFFSLFYFFDFLRSLDLLELELELRFLFFFLPLNFRLAYRPGSLWRDLEVDLSLIYLLLFLLLGDLLSRRSWVRLLRRSASLRRWRPLESLLRCSSRLLLLCSDLLFITLTRSP